MTKPTFTPLSREHAPLVRSWLSKPYVSEWYYGEGLANTLECIERFISGQPTPFSLWLAFSEKKPVAFFMTSSIEMPDDELTRWCVTQGPAITLDMLIGEEAYLGRGLAAPLIQAFIETECSHVREVLVDPQVRNVRAIHVYEKAGFRLAGEWVPQSGSMRDVPLSMMRWVS